MTSYLGREVCRCKQERTFKKYQMIIDSHQHFWKYQPERHSWKNDEMSIIRKDFLPEDLAKVYSENGIDGCVAVQADQTLEETDFLLDLADKNDFIISEELKENSLFYPYVQPIADMLINIYGDFEFDFDADELKEKVLHPNI